MSDDVVVAAMRAYDRLFESFSTGQWEGFFALFGPEVDVILPTPASGHFRGTEGRAKLVETFSQYTEGSARFDKVELIGRTVGEDRVVFEDRGKGVVFGEPYEALHCIHFIIDDGMVVGFHEYSRPV